MITYLYWTVTALTAICIIVLFSKMGKWQQGLILAAIIALGSWGAYFFHFQQLFVKRFGGVMSVTMKEGMVHLGATWKGDNLWLESYNPEKNTCHFKEYSKGNMLQGRVTIKNCNPPFTLEQDKALKNDAKNHSSNTNTKTNTKTNQAPVEPKKTADTTPKPAAQQVDKTTETQTNGTEEKTQKPITLDDMDLHLDDE